MLKKKIIFSLIVVVLIMGTFYFQKGSTNGDSFSRAMEIMKNLKSSALTDAETTTLENVFQASQARITLLEGFIEADENAIKAIIPTSVMNATAKTAFLGNIKSEQGTEEALRNLVNSNLANSISIQNDVYTIASRLRSTNNELGIRQWFVSSTPPASPSSPLSYGYIRSGLCTTASVSSYNLYGVGAVTPAFSTTEALPTFAEKIDACGTGENINTLTEYVCKEREFRNTANFSRTTTCQFGCKGGACLKGAIETVTITSNASGTEVLSDIQSDQKFYLRVIANRATDTTDALTISLSSPELTGASPKCTLTDTADTTPTVKEFNTANQAIIFGEIQCTGNPTFNLTLRDGNTEIGTTNHSVILGQNAMKEIVVIAPSEPIQGGTPSIFTVKTIGQNNLPFPSFIDPVILIVDPSLAANSNTSSIVIAPSTEKTITITFPVLTEAKTYTVFARGATFSSQPITVTVTPAASAASAVPNNPTISTPSISNEILTYVSEIGSSGTIVYQYKIVIDSSGNIFTTSWAYRGIWKYNSSGAGGKFSLGKSPNDGEQSNSQMQSGIAIDSSGNIYVADSWNHRIQKFNSSGVYLSQFGSKGSENGQLLRPDGITIDTAGNIYVADTDNNRIQKFNSSGVYLSQFGSIGTGNGQLSKPIGIALDTAGNIYVADSWNHRIQKFNSSGVYLSQFGSKGSENGQFHRPSDIALDTAGNIYVVDQLNDRIQKFNSSGVYISKSRTGDRPRGITIDTAGNIYVTSERAIQKFRNIPSDSSFFSTANNILDNTTITYVSKFQIPGNASAGFGTPNNIAIDSSGNIYSVESGNHRINKFDSSGVYLSQFGSKGSGDGQFDVPYGITIDTAGNIYVLDTGNRRIQKFNSSGIYLSQFANTGGGAGITLDTSGNIYVSGVDRIQKFNSSGVYLSQFGSKGSENGQFGYLSDIAIDSSGNIYAVDLRNHRIQKFNSSGIYLSQFGSSGPDSGKFHNPRAIAIDSSGNIYVVDSGNRRIQKFNSSGIYLSQYRYMVGLGGSIALDTAGNIYVTFPSDRSIQKFSVTSN